MAMTLEDQVRECMRWARSRAFMTSKICRASGLSREFTRNMDTPGWDPKLATLIALCAGRQKLERDVRDELDKQGGIRPRLGWRRDMVIASEQLRKWLKQTPMSSPEMAREIGLSYQLVFHYTKQSNMWNPRASTLLALARARDKKPSEPEKERATSDTPTFSGDPRYEA